MAVGTALSVTGAPCGRLLRIMRQFSPLSFTISAPRKSARRRAVVWLVPCGRAEKKCCWESGKVGDVVVCALKTVPVSGQYHRTFEYRSNRHRRLLPEAKANCPKRVYTFQKQKMDQDKILQTQSQVKHTATPPLPPSSRLGCAIVFESLRHGLVLGDELH